MKTLLSRVSPVALSLALATPALAGPVYENASGGTMTWYGHLNFGVSTVDDGVDSESNFADGTNSSSRVGIEIYQPVGNGNEFRFNFETSLGITGLGSMSQTFDDVDFDWDKGNIRHADFSLGGNWGKLYAGQGSMAADGITGNSFSDVGLVLYAGNTDFNGSYQFRTASGALSGVTLGDAYGDFDGPRLGRVRYDTPDFNGFSASVSYGKNILDSSDDDEYSDIALNYRKDFAGMKLAASLAYQNTDGTSGVDTDGVAGSVALGFDNGFSIAMAAGEQSTDGVANEPSYYYVQAAYDADLFSFGKTAFGIDYFSGDDYNTSGSESEIVGLGVVQKFNDQNVEAYLTYQVHSFDEVATNYEDVSTLAVGARWKF